VLTKEVASTATSHKSSTTKSREYKERFLVRTGSRFFLVRRDDIVAFYKDDLVLLYTKSGKKFSIDYSLDQLMNQLDPEQFFRINRQCIIHASYLEEMKMEKAQMQLTLSVTFPHSLSVSQRNIPSVRRWLGGE